MAQDYLAWDVFDNVVICAAYRAIPVLVFSEEDLGKPPKRLFPRRADEVNLSVERVGCFILSQRESAIRLQCGEYHSGTAPQHATDIDVMAFSELATNAVPACCWRYRPGSPLRRKRLSDARAEYGLFNPSYSSRWKNAYGHCR